MASKGGSYALHEACRKSDLEVVKELLKAGANVNEPDMDGNLPLHLSIIKKAISYDSTAPYSNEERSDYSDPMIWLLLSKYPEAVLLKNNDDKTPLSLASHDQAMILLESEFKRYFGDKPSLKSNELSDENVTIFKAVEYVIMSINKVPNNKLIIDQLVEFVMKLLTIILDNPNNRLIDPKSSEISNFINKMEITRTIITKTLVREVMRDETNGNILFKIENHDFIIENQGIRKLKESEFFNSILQNESELAKLQSVDEALKILKLAEKWSKFIEVTKVTVSIPKSSFIQELYEVATTDMPSLVTKKHDPSTMPIPETTLNGAIEFCLKWYKETQDLMWLDKADYYHQHRLKTLSILKEFVDLYPKSKVNDSDFPSSTSSKSPIINQDEIFGPTKDQKTIVNIIKTDFHYPLIRQEQIIDASTRETIKWREMVADHILINLPEGVSLESFHEKLQEIGFADVEIRLQAVPYSNPLHRLYFNGNSCDTLPNMIKIISELFPGSEPEPDFVDLGVSLRFPNNEKASSSEALFMNEGNAEGLEEDEELIFDILKTDFHYPLIRKDKDIEWFLDRVIEFCSKLYEKTQEPVWSDKKYYYHQHRQAILSILKEFSESDPKFNDSFFSHSLTRHPANEKSSTFTNALIIDQDEIFGPKKDQKTIVNIIKTDFHYPLIRQEQIIDASTRETIKWREMVADHILINLPEGVSLESFHEKLQEIGFADVEIRLQAVPYSNPLHRLYFNGNSCTALTKIIKSISEKFPGSEPEPDFIHILAATTIHNNQWNLKDETESGINVEPAWKIVDKAPSEVIVAVIDSGICTNHQDLSQSIPKTIEHRGINIINLLLNDKCGSNKYDIYDIEDHDREGHGTHVAGIIVANGKKVVGVAPKSKVMTLKCLDRDGHLASVDLIAGIGYAVEHRVQILNISSKCLENLSKTYEALARAKGVIVVASAGNFGKDNDNPDNSIYPATFCLNHTDENGKPRVGLDNILSVASTSQYSMLHKDHEKPSSYATNYGKQSVHLAAPGKDIYSTCKNGYGTGSGTSQAAPHVTGTIALIKSRFPYLSFQHIMNYLRAGVDKTEELEKTTIYGGKLNAGKTLMTIHHHLNESPSKIPNTSFKVWIEDFLMKEAIHLSKIAEKSIQHHYSSNKDKERIISHAMINAIEAWMKSRDACQWCQDKEILENDQRCRQEDLNNLQEVTYYKKLQEVTEINVTLLLTKLLRERDEYNIDSIYESFITMLFPSSEEETERAMSQAESAIITWIKIGNICQDCSDKNIINNDLFVFGQQKIEHQLSGWRTRGLDILDRSANELHRIAKWSWSDSENKCYSAKCAWSRLVIFCSTSYTETQNTIWLEKRDKYEKKRLEFEVLDATV
eukprot:gene4653-6537_t